MNRRKFIKAAASASLTLPALARATRRSRKPNILLLFSDQHNAAVLGAAGHPQVRTPNLDDLARQGVSFSRAYCQDGICVPSRVSMLAGQYPRTTGVLDNRDRPPLPDQIRPLHKLLRSNGYRTACFGKRHLPAALADGFDETCTTINPRQDPSDQSYRDWIKQQGPGQAQALERDFTDSFQSPLGSHVSNLRPENTAEAYTAAKTIDFLRRAKDRDQPFFCWCSFLRPHQPYTPVPKWADQYDPAEIKLPKSLRQPLEQLPPMMQNWRKNKNRPWSLAQAAQNEDHYRTYVAYYYALVTEIDYYVGRIRECLRANALAENTIVIYASDHGDFVAAHGMVEKCALGHNVYEDTLRVPLIMHWPARFKEGLVSTDLVELIDLYPTLLELANIDPPRDYNLQGRSLVPTLTHAKPLGRQYAVSENWSQLTVITDRYKLAAWLEPPNPRFDYRPFGDMLFDRKTDPLELNNLAGRPQFAHIEKMLRTHLAQWTAKTPDEAKRLNAPKALQNKKTPPRKQNNS